MRLTTFVIVAAALLASTGSSSYAAKYTCSFSIDSKSVGGTCAIELGKDCNVQYTGTALRAACGVRRASANSEALICIFYTPGDSLVSDEKKFEKMESIQSMAEQPGFAAGGNTIIASNASGSLTSVYTESSNAHKLSVTCQR